MSSFVLLSDNAEAFRDFIHVSWCYKYKNTWCSQLVRNPLYMQFLFVTSMEITNKKNICYHRNGKSHRLHGEKVSLRLTLKFCKIAFGIGALWWNTCTRMRNFENRRPGSERIRNKARTNWKFSKLSRHYFLHVTGLSMVIKNLDRNYWNTKYLHASNVWVGSFYETR